MRNNIAVFGTVFIDCKGFADESYAPKGRNLGRISFVHGGVGRNVAEVLALLGADVSFVSTVDDTLQGHTVLERLTEAGVDVSNVRARQNGMGKWLLLNDCRGSQLASLSMLPDMQVMENTVLTNVGAIIDNASHVVLEIDMTEKITEAVLSAANECGKKVYVVTAKLTDTLKDPSLLKGTEFFVCNRIEAGMLFGRDTADKTPFEMSDILREGMNRLGIASMAITMGSKGAVYRDKRTGQEGFEPAVKTHTVDVSGAGDSFFAAAVASLVRGASLNEAVKKAVRVAAMTVAGEESVCTDLSRIIKV